MKLICGDSLEILKKATPNSVDAIVTDPPYGLSFMGKKWDYDVPSVEIWKECYRVLKPGGYLLSFAGTRTQHRMAVNIEDAGFEIRDMIAWVYGSGFPKSLNIGKAVDKLQGNEREEFNPGGRYNYSFQEGNSQFVSETATGSGKRMSILPTKGTSKYEGWGTALKPALEPITVARKPLSEKTVAENVLKWGTGGINIDGSRVEAEPRSFGNPTVSENGHLAGKEPTGKWESTQGRFPANLIHDGSDEVVSLFPNTKSGNLNAGHKRGNGTGNSFTGGGGVIESNYGGDSGSAARFFYCAKASKADRDEGLDGFELGEPPASARSKPAEGRENALGNPRANHHPTVKPTKLMQYLVKLVTPKGGVVLDPFMGSGSTGKACKLEGFDFIGIEREPEYVEIAKARIENF